MRPASIYIHSPPNDSEAVYEHYSEQVTNMDYIEIIELHAALKELFDTISGYRSVRAHQLAMGVIVRAENPTILLSTLTAPLRMRETSNERRNRLY